MLEPTVQIDVTVNLTICGQAIFHFIHMIIMNELTYCGLTTIRGALIFVVFVVGSTHEIKESNSNETAACNKTTTFNAHKY